MASLVFSEAIFFIAFDWAGQQRGHGTHIAECMEVSHSAHSTVSCQAVAHLHKAKGDALIATYCPWYMMVFPAWHRLGTTVI